MSNSAKKKKLKIEPWGASEIRKYCVGRVTHIGEPLSRMPTYERHADGTINRDSCMFESLHSPLFGTIDKDQNCIFCDSSRDECTGHFLYYDLVEGVYHPVFYYNTIKFLRCLCIFCGQFLLGNYIDFVYGDPFETVLHKLYDGHRYFGPLPFEFLEILNGDGRIRLVNVNDVMIRLHLNLSSVGVKKRLDVISQECSKTNICPFCGMYQPVLVSCRENGMIGYRFEAVKKSKRGSGRKGMSLDEVMRENRLLLIQNKLKLSIEQKGVLTGGDCRRIFRQFEIFNLIYEKYLRYVRAMKNTQRCHCVFKNGKVCGT